MKIGIYDPYFDDLGGGEKYIAILGQALAKNNSVDFFWNSRKEIDAIGERFLLDLSNIKVEKNIFSPSVGIFERFIKSMKYDAIIVLSNGSIPFIGSKKFFVHFQQPMEHIKFLPFKTKIALKRVNAFFCNSYFTKSYIDEEFGVNSLVIYPPVDLHPKKIKKENIILHVGRFRVNNVNSDNRSLEDFKKQSFMIETFKKMIKGGLDHWRFVLCVSVMPGEIQLFRNLQNSVKDFPIKFIVNENNLKLWDEYNKAKIYWHASGYGEDLNKHPEYAEHFGISTVEAMGAGVVPVVINAGGQKEIVEDGKNGFLWKSENELIEKTLELIRDEQIREKLSESAKVRARDFGLKRFIQQVNNLIQ